jgi:hypothetical protein
VHAPKLGGDKQSALQETEQATAQSAITLHACCAIAEQVLQCPFTDIRQQHRQLNTQALTPLTAPTTKSRSLLLPSSLQTLPPQQAGEATHELRHYEEVAVSVGQAAVCHVGACCVNVYGVPVFTVSSADAHTQQAWVLSQWF